MTGKDNLEKFSSGLYYVLEKAGIEIHFDVSFFYQYHDADDTSYKCTSKQVPIFQNGMESAYQLGSHPGFFVRDCNETREFLMHFDAHALSYIFLMIHVPWKEYQKYNTRFLPLTTQDWSSINSELPNIFIDNLIISYATAYQKTEKISAIDIINQAGNRYLYKLVCLNGKRDNINIHNDINILSSLPYEKQTNLGTLIVTNNDLRSFLNIALCDPISIQDYKKARKLFQISAKDTFLVGDSRYIYGIIKQEKLRETKYSEFIQFQIYGPLDWEVAIYCPFTDGTTSLIQYKNSQYRIKAPSRATDAFVSAIKEISQNANIEVLNKIVEIASKQLHGTTLVFTQEAEMEVVRLGNSCFPVHPCNIVDIADRITSIDGALLCDMNGICYAIGVILDGHSSQSENISFGARHNSAKRYKAAHPQCVVVVVSEDGGITIE